MRPSPRPSSAIAMPNRSSASVGCTLASNQSVAAVTATRPARTSVRAENRAVSQEPATDERNIATETGSIRSPVSSVSRPRTSCRYSGTVKNTPIRIRFCASMVCKARPERGDAQQIEVDQRIRTGRLAGALPPGERPQQERTDGHHERGRREPEGGDGCLFRDDPPPGAGAQHPEHHQPQPERGQHHAEEVEARTVGAGGGVPQEPDGQQDAEDDDDLADEHDAPAQGRRGPAADDRPDRDPRACHPADHGVGDHAVTVLVPAGRGGRPPCRP
jgi:hypothetical protein